MTVKGSSEYRQIIWVASYPKSGNTWLRMFLEAYFLGELDINDIVSSVGDDRGELAMIGDGSEAGNLPIDLQHLTRPMAMLRLVRQYRQVNHGIPLFVKTHHANLIANGIELLPVSLTKATICIVRDPRDVLPSFAKHMGCDLNQGLEWMFDRYRTLTSAPGRMADFLSSWDANVLSYLNDDNHNTQIFKYEDMRADPVTQFSLMLKHAGIEPDRKRVEQAVQMVELDKLRAIEQKEGFGESSKHAKDQFFGQGAVGGWQDKLTEVQRHKLEKKFKRVMQRLGYLGNRRAA